LLFIKTPSCIKVVGKKWRLVNIAIAHVLNTGSKRAVSNVLNAKAVARRNKEATQRRLMAKLIYANGLQD